MVDVNDEAFLPGCILIFFQAFVVFLLFHSFCFGYWFMLSGLIERYWCYKSWSIEQMKRDGAENILLVGCVNLWLNPFFFSPKLINSFLLMCCIGKFLVVECACHRLWSPLETFFFYSWIYIYIYNISGCVRIWYVPFYGTYHLVRPTLWPHLTGPQSSRPTPLIVTDLNGLDHWIEGHFLPYIEIL